MTPDAQRQLFNLLEAVKADPRIEQYQGAQLNSDHSWMILDRYRGRYFLGIPEIMTWLAEGLQPASAAPHVQIRTTTETAPEATHDKEQNLVGGA